MLKVTAAVVLKYVEYVPPDFNSDFLQGRDAYFAGSYQWAFYTHIASSPVSLVLGLVLLSERFRPDRATRALNSLQPGLLGQEALK